MENNHTVRKECWLIKNLKNRKRQCDLILLVLQQRVKTTSMDSFGEWGGISLAGLSPTIFLKG